MKTIEELCKEIEASEALHKEVTEIGDSEALAEFLKKYDCEASAEEFEKFLSAHAQQEGELDDDAVEAVAGGTNPLFFPLTFKGFHKLMIGKGHILV